MRGPFASMNITMWLWSDLISSLVPPYLIRIAHKNIEDVYVQGVLGQISGPTGMKLSHWLTDSFPSQ